MAFRRYGGGFSSGGSGNIKVAAIGLYSLVVCCVIALLTGQAGYVVAGFALLFVFMITGMAFGGGTTTEIVEQAYQNNLELAEENVEYENYASAMELFNKAKQYGPIPKKYISSYAIAVKHTQNI